MMAWQLRQLWQHDSRCGSLRGTHALRGSLVRLVAGGSPPPPLGAGGHHHHNGGPSHPHHQGAHHSGAHRPTLRPSVCTTEHTAQLEKIRNKRYKIFNKLQNPEKTCYNRFWPDLIALPDCLYYCHPQHLLVVVSWAAAQTSPIILSCFIFVCDNCPSVLKIYSSIS